MVEFEVACKVGREPRQDDIRMAAAEALGLGENAVINVIDPTKSYQPTMVNAAAHCHIVHRSVDARNGEVKMRYRVEAYTKDETCEEYRLPEYRDVHDAEPVIVIGAGPAGMFASLKLLTLGFRPVIIERGKEVSGRKPDIARLSRSGIVNPDSNYCYGEGGAGTFSDGKLFTRSTKRGDNREVLQQFVNFGADPSIIIDAHPHIGTDKLPRLVTNIRECIVGHGGEYHFQNRVVGIDRTEDGVFTVMAEDVSTPDTGQTSEYRARAVILATGHSAVDIYEMLDRKGVGLQAKGFAMGVRVEHPQSLINRIRYRGQWEPGFPAAEYSFVEQVDNRGVFSFCMCPGGVLVPSSTEDGSIVLNGMSNSARNSKWANSGVVVSVEPEDVPQEYMQYGAFSLLRFQHDVEKRMHDYAVEHADHDGDGETNMLCAPAQRMTDFCEEQMSENLPETSYRPGVVPAPLHELLPACVAERLQKAFPLAGNKMRGYYTEDAVLLGVESRTSSPVRIVRDADTLQSPSLPGLFPCGEGAGYSGGIVSSAMDGINCALAVERLLKG